jgi:hypothetical protein
VETEKWNADSLNATERTEKKLTEVEYALFAEKVI